MNENVITNFESGYYEAAITLHEEDLEEFGEIEGSQNYYYSVARSYLETENYSRAITYYHMALEYRYGEWHNDINLGLLISYYEQRQETKALNCFNDLDLADLVYMNYDYEEDPKILLNTCLNIMDKIVLNLSLKINFNEQDAEFKKVSFRIAALKTFIKFLNRQLEEAESALFDTCRKMWTNKLEQAVFEEINKVLFKIFYGLVENYEKSQIEVLFQQYEILILNIISTNDFKYFDEQTYLSDLIKILFKKNLYNLVYKIYESNNIKGFNFDSEQLFKYAFSAEASGENSKAIMLYEKYLELYKPTGSIYNNLALLYQQENPDKAISLIRLAIELNPDEYLFYNNLGTLLKTEERFSEALPVLRKALELNPNNHIIYKALETLPPIYNGYFPNENLVKEQQEKLNEYYWETKIPPKDIKRRFRLHAKTSNYHSYIIYPFKTCSNCSSNLVYKSRLAREYERPQCEKCRHSENESWCRCKFCHKISKEQEKFLEKNKKLEDKYADLYNFWATEKGGCLTGSETLLILKLFKKYDYNWIKQAFAIAFTKQLIDYGKYVSDLLKNWDESSNLKAN